MALCGPFVTRQRGHIEGRDRCHRGQEQGYRGGPRSLQHRPAHPTTPAQNQSCSRKAVSGKLFNFFSPSISALVGHQWFDEVAHDYTDWNAGLTLGFMKHWSADVRYWDNDLSPGGCALLVTYTSGSQCDERVVGSLKAVF